MDEIGEIVEAWNDLHDPSGRRAEAVSGDPMAFFGGGGEAV